MVVADVRLTEGKILLGQFMLTVESIPIEARVSLQTYARALVCRGEATVQVTARGPKRSFGLLRNWFALHKSKFLSRWLFCPQWASVKASFKIAASAGDFPFTYLRAWLEFPGHTVSLPERPRWGYTP